MALDEAIMATIPTRKGQRERKLFELARRLQAILGADLKSSEPVPIFDKWWFNAVSMVGTKDYADSLAALESCLQARPHRVGPDTQ